MNTRLEGRGPGSTRRGLGLPGQEFRTTISDPHSVVLSWGRGVGTRCGLGVGAPVDSSPHGMGCRQSRAVVGPSYTGPRVGALWLRSKEIPLGTALTSMVTISYMWLCVFKLIKIKRHLNSVPQSHWPHTESSPTTWAHWTARIWIMSLITENSAGHHRSGGSEKLSDLPQAMWPDRSGATS